MRQPLIVIEHCEDHLSRWLLYEYENVIELAGVNRIVITNVKRREWCDKIREKLGVRCFKQSIRELQGVLYNDESEVLILDPKANDLLTPDDTRRIKVVVIGGILGAHPPLGRTQKLITSRFSKALVKSLGPHQLSIDGAVYVYLQVEKGARPQDVPLVINPKIRVEYMPGIEVEIELPFAYPLVDGKPLIPEGVMRLLKSGLGFYEAMRLE